MKQLLCACAAALFFVVGSLNAQENSKYYSPGSELLPISVWSDNEVFVDPNVKDPEQYGFSKALDGNTQTYVCILDSTRNGSRKGTNPPFAETPITAEFTIDLGEEREVCGIRLSSPVIGVVLALRISTFTLATIRAVKSTYARW